MVVAFHLHVELVVANDAEVEVVVAEEYIRRGRACAELNGLVAVHVQVEVAFKVDAIGEAVSMLEAIYTVC